MTPRRHALIVALLMALWIAVPAAGLGGRIPRGPRSGPPGPGRGSGGVAGWPRRVGVGRAGWRAPVGAPDRRAGWRGGALGGHANAAAGIPAGPEPGVDWRGGAGARAVVDAGESGGGGGCGVAGGECGRAGDVGGGLQRYGSGFGRRGLGGGGARFLDRVVDRGDDESCKVCAYVHLSVVGERCAAVLGVRAEVA